jgi:pSer/pThr/pTyr-binding forkhead associated (FHA) protein
LGYDSRSSGALVFPLLNQQETGVNSVFREMLQVIMEPEYPQGPYLMVMNGPEDGRIFGMTQNPANIGRLPSNEIALSLDPTISRLHARITQEGGTYFLEDLQSMHGTELDGVKITEKAALHSGSTIQVGETLLAFRVQANP